MPISGGTNAPPKNKSPQVKITKIQKCPTYGTTTEHADPIIAYIKHIESAELEPYPPNNWEIKPPAIQPKTGAVIDTTAKTVFTF